MPSSDDAVIHLTTLKGGSYLTGLLYDDRIGKKNGEFDCVIRRRNSYDVFKVKYLKEKASAELMNDEIKKIQSVQGISIGTIGFVSVSGFEDTLPAFVQISGEDLFAPGL